jgi:hypothetical protein
MNKKRYFISLFLFFCAIRPTSAFSPQTALGVSPAIIEQVVEQKKIHTAKIFVFNVTNFPLPIKSSVRSFIPHLDASSWIEVDPADFILQPRERKEIKITIKPPNKTEPGGHYAVVYFQPLVPVENLSPQTAYLSARVGALIFLVVKGDMVEKAVVSDLKTVKFQEKSPISFQINFKNQGNIHLLPSGNVRIFNWQGKKIDELSLKPEIVLPKTARTFRAVWQKKYLIGKFFAAAQINYGSEHLKLQAGRIEFWVVPWLPLITLIGGLTIIIIFFILIRKRLFLAVKVLIGKEDALSEEE